MGSWSLTRRRGGRGTVAQRPDSENMVGSGLNRGPEPAKRGARAVALLRRRSAWALLRIAESRAPKRASRFALPTASHESGPALRAGGQSFDPPVKTLAPRAGLSRPRRWHVGC